MLDMLFVHTKRKHWRPHIISDIFSDNTNINTFPEQLGYWPQQPGTKAQFFNTNYTITRNWIVIGFRNDYTMPFINCNWATLFRTKWNGIDLKMVLPLKLMAKRLWSRTANENWWRSHVRRVCRTHRMEHIQMQKLARERINGNKPNKNNTHTHTNWTRHTIALNHFSYRWNRYII